MRNVIDKKVYEEIIKLLTEDSTVFFNLKACFDSPKLYFNKNAGRYSERFMEDEEDDNEIAWIGITDELIESGDIIELGLKEYLEEFLCCSHGHRQRQLCDIYLSKRKT